MANITFYRTNQENEYGLYIFYMQVEDTTPRPMIMSVSTFNILQKMLTISKDIVTIIEVDIKHESLDQAKIRYFNNKS